ncbi:DNA repair protein rhp54 [Hordeum vulgare]|nr:DNA repair protein rhp54 [Hordeum vulgare]
MAGGSSSGGARKCVRQTPADQLPDARNLFDGTPAADDYMQNMIFEGGAQAAGFDPDETQSQDGRGYNENQAAFMRDQVGISLDLDGLPLNHEFPEDYGLEEEDECDIEAEPLFKDELANQADGTAAKRKSKRTKAYTAVEDKLLCECWRDIMQDPKTGAEQKHSTFWIRVHPLEAFKAQHNGKCFNLSHCFRVIKDEEKFKAQYTGLKSCGGKQAVEEVGDGEKAWPRGETNSKKEDKWDAASIALIATVEGMITEKD